MKAAVRAVCCDSVDSRCTTVSQCFGAGSFHGRSDAIAPLQTFAVAHARTAPAGDSGCPPPRMSSALGGARGSPLISLRRAPAVPGLDSRRSSSRKQPTRIGSRRWGALRSKIKEERRAQPDTGDIRGAERPAVPISRSLWHASANVCNGPTAVDRFGDIDDRFTACRRHQPSAPRFLEGCAASLFSSQLSMRGPQAFK